VIVFVLGVFSAFHVAQGLGPCQQIMEACESAGFVRGGVAGGNGLVVDCINPIMQGTTSSPKASKPLPQIDPQVVAACKSKNPSFGHLNAPLSEAVKQSAQVSTPLTSTLPNASSAAPLTGAKRPNVVFVLTDDLSLDLVQYMPHVLRMQKDGASFINYFVTDSLCCPSRSSIFTGRYPHDTGVFRNTGKDGGYLIFRSRGHEQSTFANSLSSAGYRTAMLGKYLNGYLPDTHPAAPGWTAWAVAGNGYPEFNYNLRLNDNVVHYGQKPEDYLLNSDF